MSAGSAEEAKGGLANGDVDSIRAMELWVCNGLSGFPRVGDRHGRLPTRLRAH